MAFIETIYGLTPTVANALDGRYSITGNPWDTGKINQYSAYEGMLVYSETNDKVYLFTASVSVSNLETASNWLDLTVHNSGGGDNAVTGGDGIDVTNDEISIDLYDSGGDTGHSGLRFNDNKLEVRVNANETLSIGSGGLSIHLDNDFTGSDKWTGDHDFDGAFLLKGEVVEATAAEINILDGLTTTTAELNTLDISVQNPSSGQVIMYTTTDGLHWGDTAAGVSLDSSVTDILSISDGVISADDPNGDRLVFWDDSDAKLEYAGLGTTLQHENSLVNVNQGASYTWTNNHVFQKSDGTATISIDRGGAIVDNSNIGSITFKAVSTFSFPDFVKVLAKTVDGGGGTGRLELQVSEGVNDGLQTYIDLNGDSKYVDLHKRTRLSGVSLILGSLGSGVPTDSEAGAIWYNTNDNTFRGHNGDDDTPVTFATTNDLASNFTGADGTDAGTAGLVPAPAATDNTKFLKGDGTWADLADNDTTYTAGDGINIDTDNEITVDLSGTTLQFDSAGDLLINTSHDFIGSTAWQGNNVFGTSTHYIRAGEHFNPSDSLDLVTKGYVDAAIKTPHNSSSIVPNELVIEGNPAERDITHESSNALNYVFGSASSAESLTNGETSYSTFFISFINPSNDTQIPNYKFNTDVWEHHDAGGNDLSDGYVFRFIGYKGNLNWSDFTFGNFTLHSNAQFSGETDVQVQISLRYASGEGINWENTHPVSIRGGKVLAYGYANYDNLSLNGQSRNIAMSLVDGVSSDFTIHEDDALWWTIKVVSRRDQSVGIAWSTPSGQEYKIKANATEILDKFTLNSDGDLVLQKEGDDSRTIYDYSADRLRGLNWLTGEFTHGSDTFNVITYETANAQPVYVTYDNATSPADDDIIGRWIFAGNNSDDEQVAYAEIHAQIKDTTPYDADIDGSGEDGSLYIDAVVNGTPGTELASFHKGTSRIQSALRVNNSTDPQTIAFEVYGKEKNADTDTTDLFRVNSANASTDGHIDLDVPVSIQRYTTTERDAIAGPGTGWMIYNSTVDRLQIYDGGWNEVTVDYDDEFARLYHYQNIRVDGGTLELDSDHNADILPGAFGQSSTGSLIFSIGDDKATDLIADWDDVTDTVVLVRLTNQDNLFSEPSIYRGTAFGRRSDENIFVGLDAGFEHVSGPNVLSLNNSADGDDFSVEIEADVFHPHVFNTAFDGLVPSPSSSDVSNDRLLQADGTWVDRPSSSITFVDGSDTYLSVTSITKGNNITFTPNSDATDVTIAAEQFNPKEWDYGAINNSNVDSTFQAKNNFQAFKAMNPAEEYNEFEGGENYAYYVSANSNADGYSNGDISRIIRTSGHANSGFQEGFAVKTFHYDSSGNLTHEYLLWLSFNDPVFSEDDFDTLFNNTAAGTRRWTTDDSDNYHPVASGESFGKIKSGDWVGFDLTAFLNNSGHEVQLMGIKRYTYDSNDNLELIEIEGRNPSFV